MELEKAIRAGLVLVAHEKDTNELVDIIQFENIRAFRSMRWFLRNSEYDYRVATESDLIGPWQ